MYSTYTYIWQHGSAVYVEMVVLPINYNIVRTEFSLSSSLGMYAPKELYT